MLAALCSCDTGTAFVDWGGGQGQVQNAVLGAGLGLVVLVVVVLFRSCLKSAFSTCSFLTLTCSLCFWNRTKAREHS